jgi:hypothetical protein
MGVRDERDAPRTLHPSNSSRKKLLFMVADFRSQRISRIVKKKNPSIELTSYMDETGHSDDPNFHFAGMAGFVAPAEHWKAFGEYWQTVLDMFELKEPFHMKHFAHSQGQFKDWKGKEERRKSLYGALVSGIVAFQPIPVGVVVSIEAFRSLSERQQQMFLDPYYVAFQRCSRGAATIGMCADDPEPVAMVYSYNKEFGATELQEPYSVDQAGRAVQLWHAMKENTDFGKWMGAYGSSSPTDLVHLQAADLFAYELAKEFENLLTRPKDPMRWGLRQILRNAHLPHALIALVDRLELLRIIIESNLPFKEGTDEIDDPVKQMNSARARMTGWAQNRVGIPKIEESEI